MKKSLILLIILFAFSSIQSQNLKLFKDVKTGPESSFSRLTPTSDKLFIMCNFDGDTGNNNFLISDGSTLGTLILKKMGSYGNPFIYDYTYVNSKLFFIYQNYQTSKKINQLCVTDGTPNGTIILKTFSSDFYFTGNQKHIINVGNKVLFQSETVDYGTELWETDGTVAGTKLFMDLKTNGSSWPSSFIEFNNQIYFTAVDRSIPNKALWNQRIMKTDGTKMGTTVVKDFSKEGGFFDKFLGVFDGQLFIRANDSIHGSEIWVSDGTEVGTKLLKDINTNGSSYPVGFCIFKNKVYFSAVDADHERETWSSDGTEAGTKILKDIHKTNYTEYFSEFCATTDFLYFNAFDETNGYELWKTDGTEAGTKIVKVISADTFSRPYNFAAIDNFLFFVADAGNIGEELYRTDGTEKGTIIIEPKNRTEINNLAIGPLNIYKNKLYVTANYDSAYGQEIYVYDPKENTTGIQTITNQSSYFFPNPAQNEIKIKNNIFTKVDIYDVNGRLVLESTNTKEAIDISSIPAGIYIIKMGNENAQITERLIKY